jgi:hypothetical protein
MHCFVNNKSLIFKLLSDTIRGNTMATPKKYFHDRTVLLLLSINLFVALLLVVWIAAKLQGGHTSAYFIQYRQNLGLTFRTGGVSGPLSFVVFDLATLVATVVLSRKAYPIRRQLAITLIGLGIFLQILAFIVSRQLLSLH